MPLPSMGGGGGFGGSFSTSFGDITGALGDIFGHNNSTSESTSIDPEGMKYLLESILGSTNGLASVTSGEHTSGLYNSTTNTLLVNDLLARAAGEVAARNTTTKKTDKSGGLFGQFTDLVGGGGSGILGGLTGGIGHGISHSLKHLF